MGSSLDSVVVDPNVNPELLSLDSFVSPNTKPPAGFASGSFVDSAGDPNLKPPVGFSLAAEELVEPKLKPPFELLLSGFEELSPVPNLNPPDDPNWND